MPWTGLACAGGGVPGTTARAAAGSAAAADPDDEATAALFAPWRTQSRQLVDFVRLPASEQDCVAALRDLVDRTASVIAAT